MITAIVVMVVLAMVLAVYGWQRGTSTTNPDDDSFIVPWVFSALCVIVAVILGLVAWLR